jgi:alanyl-tRNA synthetase
MTSLSDIRSAFLTYFEQNDHEIVPSGHLVPRNDPTLLFTNAGMVPFKNVFTGAEKRDYVRAASSQKCVRAGGKHNDLDNVGYTARHHTFFEMLGNFSFGDYFKERAIELAWDLLTKEFEIPTDRLLVTVFSEDNDAFDLWKKVAGLPESKIIRIPTSDNFWSMGDTGPCGPCSEIFYDHGAHIPGGPPGSPDEDGDRFVEIWNLVFMQYEQLDADTRNDLPRPSIDTGMGLERVAAVLQGVHDNYDTDLFQTLMRASLDAVGDRTNEKPSVSHRVIADHLRASCFLMADGVLPSNEGRGYVLRRIMRRGMRHAQLLGAKDPLMWRLVPTLVREMGAAFPELGRAEALMGETLELEETRFRQTLERGLGLLEDASVDLKAGDELGGDVAFKLYDTFGFPLDLTQDALRAREIGVDLVGFDAAMEKQRADARAAWAGSGEAATEAIWLDLRNIVGATEFLGYDTEHAEGQIIGLAVGEELVDVVTEGQEARIVTNQTPFYAESGGQVGDTGVIRSSGVEFKVTDTRRAAGDLFVHRGVLKRGEVATGDVVDMIVDGGRRALTRLNHSATHLMHAALRRVLGEHVTQKGSAVDADRLRFDFNHPKAMTDDEIARVEAEVNAVVRQNNEVSTRLMTPDAAIEAGAMALFGEKYGDEVRVLTMGDNPDDGASPYSVELCGGTHVRRIGDIALFKIVTESAVAAGVRRLEALTGEAAREFLEGMADTAKSAAGVLKTTPGELPTRVAALLEDRKRLERELADARRAVALGGGGGGDDVQEINGLKLIARVIEGANPKELRGLIDDAKKKIGSGVVALACKSGDKSAIAVGVTKDLTDRLDAVELVRSGSEALGGKGGGGRPDMAQAGGPGGGDLEAALAAITKSIETIAA